MLLAIVDMASNGSSCLPISPEASTANRDEVSSQLDNKTINNLGPNTGPEILSTSKSDNNAKPEDDTGFIQGYRLFCMITGLTLAVFCMGLVSCRSSRSPSVYERQNYLVARLTIAFSQPIRIGPSSPQRYPELRRSLTRSTILPGTVLPIY